MRLCRGRDEGFRVFPATVLRNCLGYNDSRWHWCSTLRGRTKWGSTQQCLTILEVSGTKSFETLYLRPGLLHPGTQLLSSDLQQTHVAMHADREALQKVPKCRHTAAHQTHTKLNLFPFCTSQQSAGHHAAALSTEHFYRRTSGHCLGNVRAVTDLIRPVPLTAPCPPVRIITTDTT
jgi:hypothetical protein